MNTETVQFDGATGATLSGRLELPAHTPHAVAVFAHCFTCSKNSKAATRVSRALAADGVAVLRFDFTGLGDSGGDFAHSHYSANVADLLKATEFMTERFDLPLLVIGHSLGGAAALAAVHRLEAVAGVVTIGAPSDPAHVEHLFADAVPEIEARGSHEVVLGGRTFCVTDDFVQDLRAHDAATAIGDLNAPLLVLHAPLDNVVGVDHARVIFESARHPKSFVALDGADHFLSRPEDGEYVARVIRAWAARSLVTADTTGFETERHVEGSVVVAENGVGDFSQDVLAAGHVLAADEPVPTGDNTGPSPYDLLAAGLGACTSMTIRMYANRRNYPLDHVHVTVTHDRVHAQDSDATSDSRAKVDRFTRAVTVKGDLTEEQRQDLLRVANKCPVHKTLEASSVVETHLE
ncbi:bifunctional alpha/beta hydrolase/OsmC family protein [Demequina flava]|uniref:bifunctional alpha/beta hydrolase/OsmC family protein n=1 Tax=Demequina flava TaxID=1095025 RepID=UPI0007861C4C|nr:bifunctional alpha/beta hydrolase/OsmC family protein [Demequina flava]